MPNEPFEIQLLGRRIVLKSGGEPEVAREVIALVNERIQTAEKRSRDQVPHHIALLALLDLAESHVRARHRVADHQRQVEEKSQALLSLLGEQD